MARFSRNGSRGEIPEEQPRIKYGPPDPGVERRPITPEERLPGAPDSRLAAEIIAWLYRDALKELPE